MLLCCCFYLQLLHKYTQVRKKSKFGPVKEEEKCLVEGTFKLVTDNADFRCLPKDALTALTAPTTSQRRKQVTR